MSDSSTLQSTDWENYEFGRMITMPTIETIHYGEYSLETWRFNGLRCNEHINHFTASVEIPNFGNLVKVVQADDSLTWSFDLPVIHAENVSFTSDSRITPFMEKHKMRHEFVSETFGNTNTDVKLSSIFPAEGDDNDMISPDFGFVDHNGIFHFLEVGTTLATNLDQLDKVVMQKLFKYQDPIDLRISKTESKIGVLTTVIISPRTVASNINLPQDVVNELLMRVNIMIAVENVAIGMGIKIKDDEAESKKTLIQEMIMNDIGKMGIDRALPTDNAIVITNDYYKKVIRMKVEKKTIMKDYLKELGDESNRINKELKIRKQNKNGNLRPTHQLINILRSEMNEGNRRTYKKPVVLFPFVNPRVTNSELIPSYLSIGDNEEIPAVVSTWNAAMNSMAKNEDWHEDDLEALRTEAYETEPSNIETLVQQRKERRAKYHRVQVAKDLSKGELQDLQSDGIWAKKTKKENWRKVRLENQRAGFTWDTETNDIQEFINDSQKIWEDLGSVPTPQEATFDLISESNKFIGNKETGLNFCKSVIRSRAGNFCDWISDLAMELAISNKQHCKKNYMILKKLRYYDVYVLILPTTSSSHCFFSLLFPYLNMDTQHIETNGVFRKVYDCGNCHLTDFVSLRCDKLENIASSVSNLISSSAYWCFFHDKDCKHSEILESSEVKKMIALTMLISLEDKAETEETITNTRYQYMELLKSDITFCKPDPLKMLEKFNRFPRSRLNLYCMKRILISFDIMACNPPKKVIQHSSGGLKLDDEEVGDNSPPDDSWNGFYNWATGSPVKRFSRIVNLFYIGYMKNKNEMSQSNSDLKLIEKALEEEYKIDYGDRKKLYGDIRERPKGKQFSLEHVVFGCDELEKHLISILGPNYKENLKKECLEALSEQLTHEIATLKASSSIDHEEVFSDKLIEEDQTVDESDKSEGKEMRDEIRIKVIEAVHKELKLLGLNPFTRISKIILEIEESSKGVIADLFKKQQHGGLREIYVLTIKSRMVQLFIEVLSRTICRKFEEETLTHPKNKLVIIDNHKSKAAKIANARQCVYLEMNSSSDKTRWNQNFIMTAMCVPLFRLLPEDFHSIIQRILNLWARKKLRIPSSVLKMIYNNTKLSSKTFVKLCEDFWATEEEIELRNKRGKNDYSIFPKGMNKKFITLTSGMMQGILHYTSSLLHLTLLFSSAELVRMSLQTSLPDCKFLISKMCSSDDSAIMITGFSETQTSKIDKRVKKMARNIEMSLHALTTYCQYFCMRESIKSTIAVPNYVEFNSEFVCSNTLCVPVIKMVAASTNLTESESYISRFHNQYNLLSDIFNGGLPAKYTHVCQLSQALLHYKTMGQNINALYDDYTSSLKKLPHPKFGFFCIDSELMPGIMGYSFTLWNILNQTNQLRLNRKTVILNNLEVSEDGSIVESLNIINGDVKRWKKLVNALKPFDKDMTQMEEEEFFSSNSELFFNHPNDERELRVKLYLKSLMPGVAQSMSRGNQFLQSLVLSVFSINTHCFTSKSLVKEVEEGVSKLKIVKTKTCLLLEIEREISERDRQLSEFDGTEDEFWCESNITIEEELLLFPNCDRYKEVIRIIRSFKNSLLIKRPPYRHRKNQIIIQPKVTPIPLNLMQTVRKLWYGHNIPVSKTVYERCLEFYTTMFPWISKKGFTETLKNSPFQTPAELYSFISTQNLKSRRVVRVGPPIYSNKFTGQITQLIMKSQREGHVLKRSKDKIDHDLGKTQDTDQIMTKVTLALLLPGAERRRREVESVLTNSPLLFNHITEIPNMNERLQRLSYIQAFLKGKINAPSLITSLRKSNKGVFLSFLREQEKVMINNKITWKGRGMVLIIYENNTFKFSLKDDLVERIEVSSWERIKNHPSVIKSILTDLLHCKHNNIVGDLRACAKYSNGRFTHASTSGIPIIVNQDMDITYFEPKQIGVRVTKGSISLIHNTGRVEVPIITYKSNSYDLNQYSTGEETRDCWKAWIEQKSWSEKEAFSRIYMLYEKETTLNRPLNESEDHEKIWLRDTLKHRLNYKKVGHSMTVVAESLITMESQINQEEMEIYDLDQINSEFMSIDNMFETTEPSEGGNTLTIEEYTKSSDPTVSHYKENEIIEFYNDHGINIDPELDYMAVAIKNNLEANIPYSEEVNEKNLFSFMYIHCFWDRFINYIEEMNPQLLGKTMNAIQVIADQDVQVILFWLLDIKPKQREESLMQRFLRTRPGIEDVIEVVKEELSDDDN